MWSVAIGRGSAAVARGYKIAGLVSTTGRWPGKREEGTDRPRWFYLAMVVVLGSVLLVSRFMQPPRSFSLCLVEMYTGYPCVTTGLTRAFHAISMGSPRAALAYHPLSLFLYGLVIFHLLIACLRLLGWRFRLIRVSNAVPAMFWGTTALLFVFWLPRVLVMVLARKLTA